MKTFFYSILMFFAVTAVFAQNTQSLHGKALNVLSCIEKNDFKGVEVYYDETMKQAVPAPKLKEAWTGIIQQYGTFVKHTKVTDSTYQQYKLVNIMCVFDNGMLRMEVYFDKNEKVAGLYFRPANGLAPAQSISELHGNAIAVLNCLKNENFTGLAAYYNEVMNRQLTAAKMQEVWSGLNQQCGPFIKYTTVSDTIIQQYRVVNVVCLFKNAKLKMQTTFDTDKKVAGLYFLPIR